MTERKFGVTSDCSDAMIAVLAHNWWAIAIRRVLAFLFGLVALFLRGATMLSLVCLFSFYLLLDDIFGIVSSIRAASQHERRGLVLFEGIVDIAAAAIAFLWSIVTVLAFVLLIAAWAIVSGALMIMAALWRLGASGISGAALIAFSFSPRALQDRHPVERMTFPKAA